MICQIEALNFRCLRYVDQPLENFHVLVGPNASGKTTFFDVISFLGQLVTKGLDAAVGERTSNFQDLVWARTGTKFELALEATIPNPLKKRLLDSDFERVRYEVAIELKKKAGEIQITAERVVLKKAQPSPNRLDWRFPNPPLPPNTIQTKKNARGVRTTVNKINGGKANFYSEVKRTGRNWLSFNFGPGKSALGNLPEDNQMFPVSIWLKTLLTQGVQPFALNSLLIRNASRPGQERLFKPDGSNLPWVVHRLQQTAPDRVQDWIAHLQTALPDIEAIRTVERPDDKHRYLMIRYRGGLEVPSWMASDGTLRLLALTLPAYLTDFAGVYLIEEPENGIHPRAVETMFQSLSSVYDAQLLLATHSPVILGLADVSSVLCFAKTEEGATDIVRGDQHPRLREWRGETGLGVLFASGVLG